MRVSIFAILFTVACAAGLAAQCDGTGCTMRKVASGVDAGLDWDYVPGIGDVATGTCPTNCQGTISCKFNGDVKVTNMTGQDRKVYDHLGALRATQGSGGSSQYPVNTAIEPGCGDAGKTWKVYTAGGTWTSTYELSCTMCNLAVH